MGISTRDINLLLHTVLKYKGFCKLSVNLYTTKFWKGVEGTQKKKKKEREEKEGGRREEEEAKTVYVPGNL